MAKKQSMTMVLVDRSQDILKKLDGFGRCAEEMVQEIRENEQDNHGLRRESASELAKYERVAGQNKIPSLGMRTFFWT